VMFGLKLLFLLSLAATRAIAAPAADAACSALWNQMPTQIANLTITVAEAYADNSTFVSDVPYPTNPNVTTGLPAFCRFGAYVGTSDISEFYFEVWLPSAQRWNQRMVSIGNGGVAGTVFHNRMGVPLNDTYAVAATNTGHWGLSGNGSFALNNPESQIDFGYRAVHLTAVYAKLVISTYYGSAPRYSYWTGCSSGGKQGLKEIQYDADTFDGALVGAPAQWWSMLNGFTQHINSVNDPTDNSSFIPPPRFALIGRDVVQQCDLLDGLADGIIANPDLCKPNITAFTCGN